MSSDPTKKPPLKAVSEPEQLQDQIRERAYELYESRGREDGHDLEDWQGRRFVPLPPDHSPKDNDLPRNQSGAFLYPLL